jgi:hypothetical protein
LRQTIQANLRDESRNQYVPERIRDDAEPARFYSIKRAESKRESSTVVSEFEVMNRLAILPPVA